MNIFILAAGEGTRWGNALGAPKQLADVAGKPLLAHMLEKLHARRAQYGIDRVMVVASDPKLHVLDAEFIDPGKTRLTLESLLSSRPYWTEDNLILLGDVFFSDHALDTILSHKSDLAFYGRTGKNRITRCRGKELFALRFGSAAQTRFLEAADRALAHFEKGGWDRLWVLYRALAGLDLVETAFDESLLLKIGDITDDIDSPEEYAHCAKVWRHYLNDSPWSRFMLAWYDSPFVYRAWRLPIDIKKLVLRRIPGTKLYEERQRRLAFRRQYRATDS
ncbi:MAG TPA: NTP transferase domain-containing protein [Gammaproteobacteria bacterium]|jgi:hypothetical protein|nr:NTP transferase domain-containing protein [Gammaproteobacteria bacterium]